MKIGDRIRNKRKELGLSLRELAEQLDISFSMLAKYERNESLLNNLQIENIAKVLRTTPAYLMGWSDNEKYEHIDKSIDISSLTEEEKEELNHKLSLVTLVFSDGKPLNEETQQELKDIITKFYFKVKKNKK